MPEYTITEVVTYIVEARSRRQAMDRVFNQPNGTITHFAECNERELFGPYAAEDLCSECDDPLVSDALLDESNVTCDACELSTITPVTCG